MTSKQDEKFEIAKDYLLGLPKDVALTQLQENSFFSNELGPVNYSKLKVLLQG